jgi:MFS family permease
MLVYGASNGIVVHTLPLLNPELIDEFGWTTAQVTLPATIFYIFGAISSPPAGVLFDRFSPRKIMFFGIIGLISSLFAFASVKELWHLVAVFLVFGLSLSLCGLTASMVVLTKWFDGKRGRATGLLLLASSFGGSLFPLLLGKGMENYGWRVGITMIAVVGLLMAIPAILFLILDRPRPGDALDKPAVATIAGPKSGPTLRATLQTPTFYLIAIATGGMWFCIVALLQHQSIHLVKDVGIDRTLLPKMFSLFYVCSLIGKFGFGWLSDHLNKEISMILSILAFIGGLFMVRGMQADDNTMLFAYAVIAGIGFSGAFTTIQMLIAQHYAGASYGKILALLVMIDSLAGGFGARIIAKMRDGSDSYIPAIDFMIAICIAAMLSVFVIKYINRPSGQPTETMET